MNHYIMGHSWNKTKGYPLKQTIVSGWNSHKVNAQPFHLTITTLINHTQPFKKIAYMHFQILSQIEMKVIIRFVQYAN